MLHPSYTDLMKVVNQDVEEGATKMQINKRSSIPCSCLRGILMIGDFIFR